METDWDEVVDALSQFDLSKDLYLPISDSGSSDSHGSHWSLLVFKNSKWLYYDSVGVARVPEKVDKIANLIDKVRSTKNDNPKVVKTNTQGENLAYKNLFFFKVTLSTVEFLFSHGWKRSQAG